MKLFFPIALLATTIFITRPAAAQDVVVAGNAAVVQPVIQTVPVVIQLVPVIIQQPVYVTAPANCYRPNVVYIGRGYSSPYSSPYYSSCTGTRGYTGYRYGSCSPNVVYFGRGEARARGYQFTRHR